jgi:sulfatase maturation enzyme AslB (radical SAM superfamily)
MGYDEATGSRFSAERNGFSGGEPTPPDRDFFKRVIECRNKFDKKRGVSYKNSIQDIRCAA